MVARYSARWQTHFRLFVAALLSKAVAERSEISLCKAFSLAEQNIYLYLVFAHFFTLCSTACFVSFVVPINVSRVCPNLKKICYLLQYNNTQSVIKLSRNLFHTGFLQLIIAIQRKLATALGFVFVNGVLCKTPTIPMSLPLSLWLWK